MLTSSGVLLIASWLVLSLGQGYYSMMLFPFLMTVVLPNSVIRNWPAWLAIYGFLSADRWLLGHWPTTGRALEYLRVTWGWSLMLVVVFACCTSATSTPRPTIGCSSASTRRG